MAMVNGFSIDPDRIYTPREVSQLYTAHVRHVSYPTVLEWIQIYNNSGGREGMRAMKSPRGRYLITSEEVERILLQAGAKKREE
jgi:hypothetical protein